MPITDIMKAALSRPAGKVVDAPVREIVREVIRDHGFAGPTEVKKLRDEIAALQERVGKLEATLASGLPAAPMGPASATEAARITLLENRARAFEEAAARMEVETIRIVRTVERVLAERKDPARVIAAERCQVEGCLDSAERMGFCQRHHAAWRQGTLKEFVGPEGLVSAGLTTWRVDEALAGKPFVVKGKGQTRKVYVSGKAVASSPVT